jgi:hypothetical protein
MVFSKLCSMLETRGLLFPFGHRHNKKKTLRIYLIFYFLCPQINARLTLGGVIFLKFRSGYTTLVCFTGPEHSIFFSSHFLPPLDAPLLPTAPPRCGRVLPKLRKLIFASRCVARSSHAAPPPTKERVDKKKNGDDAKQGVSPACLRHKARGSEVFLHAPTTLEGWVGVPRN